MQQNKSVGHNGRGPIHLRRLQSMPRELFAVSHRTKYMTIGRRQRLSCRVISNKPESTEGHRWTA